MQLIKQSESTSARKKVPFTAVSSTNLQTRVDPDTLTFTVRVIKADGSSVAGAGSITHPDDTNALGVCYYEPHANDVNTLGVAVIRISAAGMETREIPVLVVPWDPYSATSLGLTDLSTSKTNIERVLGLLHENAMVDNVVYGAQNIITSARVRVFADAAALAAAVAGHANGADGEVFRYTITGVDAGSGQFTSHKISRAL